ITSGMGQELAPRLSRLGFQLGDEIFLRVFKEESELEVWLKPEGERYFKIFKVFRLTAWAGTVGPKLREGDGQSPEGFYYVSLNRMRPDTQHHLGIDLGFPNDFDSHHNRTGSDLMIHGGAGAAGGFAVSPEHMSEIYTLCEAALKNGQKYFRVHALPFRMTDKRMEQEAQRGSRWFDFWVNLKEGYDFFENVNYPPDVSISGDDYAYRLH
ncbi:MAG: 2-dehydro-3-deoxyphosphooctonate aldolase, partial [Verrucomicrobiota bacterium]